MRTLATLITGLSLGLAVGCSKPPTGPTTGGQQEQPTKGSETTKQNTPSGGAAQAAEASPAASPGDGASDGMAAYERFVTACKKKDVEALWTMFDPSFKAGIERLAKDLQQVGASGLQEVYGYRGELSAFDGKTYFGLTLSKDSPVDNLCHAADKWQVMGSGMQGGVFVVAVRHPEGIGNAVRLQQRGDDWIVLEVTAHRELPK